MTADREELARRQAELVGALVAEGRLPWEGRLELLGVELRHRWSAAAAGARGAAAPARRVVAAAALPMSSVAT